MVDIICFHPLKGLEEKPNNETITPTQVDLDLPCPPDGGWGWVVVLACFMCNLILGKVVVLVRFLGARTSLGTFALETFVTFGDFW